MSYILDALKKAAEERGQDQQTEPLSYAQSFPAPSPRRRRPSRSTVAALFLLIGACCSVAWFASGRREASRQVPSEQRSVQTEPQATGTAPIIPRLTAPLKKTFPTQATDRPTTLTAESAPPADREGGLSAEPPLLADLPAALRSEIPQIAFNGHVYSDDRTARMIMANNRIVREQDLVAPETRLEEITVTGVILRYRDTTFRIELLPPP